MNKSALTVGLVQSQVYKGDVEKNLDTHIEHIQNAALKGADLVMFPELSLTGYELNLLATLAMDSSHPAILALSKASTKYQIVVIAGAPLTNEGDKPHIGAFVCFPDGRVCQYAKQYLHQGEDMYASTGDQNFLFEINGLRCALAICADFLDPRHALAANELRADVYLVSALISHCGFGADSDVLKNIAKQYEMPVVLSNYRVETGGLLGCGRSGIWQCNDRNISLETDDELVIQTIN